LTSLDLLFNSAPQRVAAACRENDLAIRLRAEMPV